jgi:hypothetical protein
LLSLSVCGTREYCLYFEIAKHNSKKHKKSLFYEEKSLVGLTPVVAIFYHVVIFIMVSDMQVKKLRRGKPFSPIVARVMPRTTGNK